MNAKTAFTTHRLGRFELKNRMVMAPMTRSRALNNIPNDLMARYYAQRASAGLIITEGTSPSPNGLGYARMPGIYSADQITGWKKITQAVHERGGKIFVQLMHSGRIGHALNLPEGARLVAPSEVQASGEIWTDQEGLLNFSKAQGMSAEQLASTKAEFVQAAKNAIEAGFDGVELHAANGYLLEQFLAPNTNQRTDNYGGGIENRARFVLETVKEMVDAIGHDRTAIRLSPFGTYNDIQRYSGTDVMYNYLAEELNKLDIAYIHLYDQHAGSNPEISDLQKSLRNKFKNTLILAGGYTLARAEETISAGLSDLVAFGRPFINNPDLVSRFRKNLPLNLELHANTLYSAGEQGYTDYPAFKQVLVSV